ncbi:MAG: aldo/keto reductase [Campylobacterota bacterium]|nr:aldo/keto reductase [Campylobacterota bacterium]
MLEKISFGTYRTTFQNPVHSDALNYALENGVKYIDTSSNYMYGEAETLVGQALKNRNRDEFTIVSKGGYIQGPNMERVKEGWEVEDLVEYDPNCFHSISPMFLIDQIENSLKRLECEYIDVYLLHNPEYYLMTNLKGTATNEDIEKHHKIMQQRIKKAFEALEEQVEKGNIKAYGISSNSFSKKENDYHFLEYKNLIEYAKSIAGKNHHFKVIQLPLNMYEKDGVPCAKWAYENGLEVHANRPLNAFYMGGMLRLASYDKCEHFDELMGEIKKIENKKLQALIDDLLENQSGFGFAGDVDDTIEYQVIPYITQVLKIDQKYYPLLDQFLNCYKANIKHSLSKITSKKLGIEEPLEKNALEYLLKKHYITKVLVGMRTKEYVDNVISYTKGI